MNTVTECLLDIGPPLPDTVTCEHAPATQTPPDAMCLRALMSWLADSHVSTFLSLGKARVLHLAHVLVFGSKWRVSYPNFDRALLSWRTSQLSLFGEDSPLLDRLPKWGMTRGGALYERVTPVRPISANDGSVWPTIKASEIEETPKQWEQRRKKPSSKVGGPSLTVAVKWGTPTSRDHKDGAHIGNTPINGLLGCQVVAKHWPTVTVDDANNVTRESGAFQSLTRTAKNWTTPRAGSDTMVGGTNHLKALQGTELEANRGSLNPDWVEALMGYPPGWTLPDGLPHPALNTHGNRRA